MDHISDNISNQTLDKAEVQRLSKLARILISDEEAEKLSHEFEAILKYVTDVKKVGGTGVSKSEGSKNIVHNIMREDTDPHERGIYTEKILSEAPSREGNHIRVKKILG